MAGLKVRFAPLRADAVEGWIEGLSEDAAISLFIDDRLEGHGIADQHRPDGARGFTLALPLHVRDGRVHKIALRLKDKASELGPYPLIGVIAHDPAPESQRAVADFAAQKSAGQKPVPEAPSETIDAPYRARIDGIKRGRKRLLVRGWAARPDGSALGTNLRLKLGKQQVIIPADGFHTDRVSFAALFDINPRAKLPDAIILDTGDGTATLILSLDGAGEAAIADIALNEDREISGWYADLDGDLDRLALRPAGLTSWEVRLDRSSGRIFDSQGAARAHITLSLLPVIRLLVWDESNFVLEGDRLPIELLDPDGVIVHTASVKITMPVRLNVELATPQRLSGWMIDPHHPNRTAELDLYVDGVRYDTIRATRHRQDVIAAGLATQGGGFEAVPAVLGEGEHRWQFAPPLTKQFLDNGHLITVPCRPSPLRTLYANLSGARSVTVVVSLLGGRLDASEFNGQCLNALRHHTLGVRWVAIGEGDFEGVECHDLFNCLATAAELAGDDDLVWIDGTVTVTPGWLDGLRAAAHSDPRIATVTALAGNGPFAVPIQSSDPHEKARRIRQASAGSYPRIFATDRNCVYIPRVALDRSADLEVGLDQWIDATTDAGMIHIIDDRTLISRATQMTDARFVTQDNDALTAVRWRIRRSLAENPEPPKPRLLYVISTRGGGTPETNRDLMQAVSGEYEPWVLVSDARTLELYRWRDGREELAETITLDAAIQPTLHRSAEYDDAVAYLLLKHAFEGVHIRHLGWHGAGLPEVAKRLGLPVIFSIHDFYTVCPNTKLLDDLNRYCGGCTQKADEPPRATDCASELWPQDQFPRIRDGFVHRWREIFAEVFRHCDAFVTTSKSAREVCLRIYPQLADADFRVIPHGRTFDHTRQSATRPDPRKRLKILVPGNISPPKGADLINALVAMDTDQRLEFHMLGDAEWIAPAETVIRHGRYKREEFAARVAAIAPHIGMVPSICPETFCHTLTEMWASGLAVAGLDLGAVGDRLRQHQAGWLLPANADIAGCYDVLTSISEDDWQTKTDAVAHWQAGENIAHSTAWMGAQYAALYRARVKP